MRTSRPVLRLGVVGGGRMGGLLHGAEEVSSLSRARADDAVSPLLLQSDGAIGMVALTATDKAAAWRDFLRSEVEAWPWGAGADCMGSVVGGAQRV